MNTNAIASFRNDQIPSAAPDEPTPFPEWSRENIEARPQAQDGVDEPGRILGRNLASHFADEESGTCQPGEVSGPFTTESGLMSTQNPVFLKDGDTSGGADDY